VPLFPARRNRSSGVPAFADGQQPSRLTIFGGHVNSSLYRDASSAIRALHFDGRKATLLPSLTTGRWAAMAGALHDADGQPWFVVTGGLDLSRTDESNLKSTEVLAPGAMRWMPGPPLDEARRASAFVTFNNSLFILGGWTGNSIAKAQVLRDPAGQWEALPSMPAAVGAASAAVYNNRIYVVGGEVFTAVVTTVQSFDGVSWRLETSMSEPRRDMVGLTSFHGLLWAVGGGNDKSGNLVATTEVFNGTVWTAGPAMVEPRASGILGILPCSP
jgi:hypothetical protein